MTQSSDLKLRNPEGSGDPRALLRAEMAIADFKDGDDAAVARMPAADIVEARALLRSELVAPLIRSGDHGRAVLALRALVDAQPALLEDRLQMASLLSRLGRRPESIAVLEKAPAALRLEPGLLAARIQFYLQEKRGDTAAAIAGGFGTWPVIEPRLAHLALLALTRHGDTDAAMKLARSYSGEMTAEVAALAVSTARASGDARQALQWGKDALAKGLDSASLRADLAGIYQSLHDHDRAIEHLSAGAELNPGNVRIAADLGELLVTRGRPNAALRYLRLAVEAAPRLTHLRAVYARALKEAGDFEGAAREFLTVARSEPRVHQWKRHAAAALNQSGRPGEAASLFEQGIADRDVGLPYEFREGLDALWDKVETVSIPQARLDWAWSLRGEDWTDDRRQDWERRAKWGYLADRLVFDWLECRTDRAEEAMWQLADLDSTSRFFNDVRGDGELIIASAHLGPMFAGPLALELMDFPSKWMASTPAVASASYVDSLISTSDQTEAKVVRQTIKALEEGYAVTIAIDGAMSMSAPRIMFEGQEITYSAFAARLAYRRGAKSAFAVPQWQDGRFAFHLVELPAPDAVAEDIETFAARWRDAYLRETRRLLGREPENLRLSGGLWRHIR